MTFGKKVILRKWERYHESCLELRNAQTRKCYQSGCGTKVDSQQQARTNCSSHTGDGSKPLELQTLYKPDVHSCRAMTFFRNLKHCSKILVHIRLTETLLQQICLMLIHNVNFPFYPKGAPLCRNKVSVEATGV